MTQPDDLTIERHTDLDMDVSELWALISTTHGWSSWLVDEVELNILTGQTGTAINDGVERSVQIDAVDEGRAIGFSWWDRDDPASRSYVQLDIVELPDSRSQLHITERFVGTSPTAAAAVSCSIAWDVKLVSLWLLALPFLVMA
jgi:hypothetical protein